ncbi:hypothetical protein DBB_32970 [Desulfoluna spongiiphila]|nr:hypothetical protein DBB_32970 [Desulfoluna spongiiphila]
MKRRWAWTDGAVSVVFLRSTEWAAFRETDPERRFFLWGTEKGLRARPLGLKHSGNQLSRWFTLPPEAAKLKMPPAALPGAKLLFDLKTTGLINRF